MIHKRYKYKHLGLFALFIAAIVLMTGSKASATESKSANSSQIKQEQLKYASDFYGIPEDMILSMPSSESEALLSLTDLELWKMRQLDDRMYEHNNQSVSYYIQVYWDSQGNLYSAQRDEADYTDWKEAGGFEAGVNSRQPSGWLKATISIADIDLLYEQLGFSCTWLEKPDVDAFEESIVFSWKNGYYPPDSKQHEYSAYGYIEGDEWHLEGYPYQEDAAALDEYKTLSFSREYGKKNTARTEETIFASVNVRKNYIAEVEQITINCEILPKGTLHNIRASVSGSQNPIQTFKQNITSLFGKPQKLWAAAWNGTLKRAYTDKVPSAWAESNREKFIYNIYEVVLDREPTFDELNTTAMKLKCANMRFSDMNRYDIIEEYGPEMYVTDFITMLFSSEEFKQRSLTTEELLGAVLAATVQEGYGPYTKDEWVDRFNNGMTVQEALSVCYETVVFNSYCVNMDVYSYR